MLATDVPTHELATYTVDGTERSLIAAEHAPDHLEILDVPEDPDGSDPDAIQVEPRVVALDEAQAIAVDYVVLARRLGWTPMPDVWW